MGDGLTLGVTLSLPFSMALPGNDLPQSLDEVPGSWSIGYDGEAYFDGMDDMVPVDWNPKGLRVSDRAGLLVTPEGQMCVFVNGQKVVHRLDSAIPPGTPLYAMLDLLGATSAVSLVPDARPPVYARTSPVQGTRNLLF